MGLSELLKETLDHEPPKHIDRNTSINDFVRSLGGRGTSWGENPNRDGVPARVYAALVYFLPKHYPEVRTLGDLDQLREEGLCLTLGRARQFGERSGQYLNAMLERYGIEPILWKPARYTNKKEKYGRS